MLKNRFVAVVIIVLVFAACKKQKETVTNVNDRSAVNDFDSIAIQKLPYSFAFDKDSILDYHYTLETFESTSKIDKNAKLNSYFSDSTVFYDNENLFITDSKNYPYKGEAYFYTRLPNINDIKVLIFTYENSEEPETLPYFEIQTFDKNNTIIDKLILAGGINYDCSWDRQYAIDNDYKIIIIDNESCFNPEDEMQELKKTIKTHYKIGNNGIIEKLLSEGV